MADSSDQEFEPRPVNPRYANNGNNSIALMKSSVTDDRLKSKRELRTISFAHGAPGTQDHQHLWRNRQFLSSRFDAFREHTLQQDPKSAATPDDIIRFMSTILPHLKPKNTGKPAVNENYLTQAATIIISYAKYLNRDFRWAEYDHIRLSSWLDQKVKDGLLIRGRWSQKVYAGFVVVSRLCEAWLQHHLAHGAYSWDIIVAKLLSITLTSACIARSGDLGKSRGWTDTEALRWSDVSLLVEPDSVPDLPYNITVQVILRYTKGNKDVRGSDRVVEFSRLEPTDQHCCPVTWILVHCLRHGLVQATSIQDLLAITAARSDHRVQFTHKDWPVLCSFHQGRPNYCDVEQPCPTQQICVTTQEMGLTAGFLAPIVAHSLRHGGARDTAHLAESTSGFVNNTVRQALGHSHQAFSRGTTQGYAGDPDRHFLNDRQERSYSSKYDAPFAAESPVATVKAKVTEEEIVSWLNRHEPENISTRSTRVRNRAITGVRKERKGYWMEEATREPKVSKVSTRATNQNRPTSESERPIPSNIDPRARTNFGEDESLYDNVPTDAQGLSTLMNVIMPNDENTDQDDPEMYKNIAMDAITPPRESASTMIQFVEKFSRINVMKSRVVAAFFKRTPQGTWESTIPTQDASGPNSGWTHMMGNSRDPISPWFYSCKAVDGCDFQSPILTIIQGHEVTCTGAGVQSAAREKTFMCPRDDCGKSFAKRDAMRKHEKTHDYEPLPCPHGCDDGKLFPKQNELQKHIKKVHTDQASGAYPTVCLFPLCPTALSTPPQKFAHVDSMSLHLTKTHNLTTREARHPHLPGSKLLTPRFKTRCPYQGCKSITLWESRYQLRRHLMLSHKMDHEEAEVMFERLLEGLASEEADESRKRIALEDVDMNGGKKRRVGG
ncbi:MAG: hypothetical protein Q9204_001567 [Flavoplaca sp. TL-2023a]